ncbi:MAG: hypothetical protein KH135_05685 [Firmicutes bacterium]|nr:hypothetical protein [Bacillota bacterium]
MRVQKLVFYNSMQEIRKKKLVSKKEQLEYHLNHYSLYLKDTYLTQLKHSRNRGCIYIPIQIIGFTLLPIYYGYHQLTFMSLSTSLVTSYITILASSYHLEKNNVYVKGTKHRQKMEKKLTKINSKLQKKYHK